MNCRPMNGAPRASHLPWVGLLTMVALVLGRPGLAQGFEEGFRGEPSEVGWRVAGDPAQFVWDANTEVLRVTWDSARSNAYFARSLGTVLNRYDDFAFGFTIQLDEIAVGVTPGKPFTFELAVGLVNWAGATNVTFRRGTGNGSPNLVEFAYFPDSGYGATVWPTVVGRDGRFNYQGRDDFTVLELRAGVRHRVELEYSAADQTLRTALWQDGASAGPINAVRLTERFTDFAVDTLAICSYSDAGAQGSLRATGWVDDIAVRVPPPPFERVTGHWLDGRWQVGFTTRPNWTNWVYALQRGHLATDWVTVGTDVISGPDGTLVLTDPEPLPDAFYRVRADKP